MFGAREGDIFLMAAGAVGSSADDPQPRDERVACAHLGGARDAPDLGFDADDDECLAPSCPTARTS